MSFDPTDMCEYVDECAHACCDIRDDVPISAQLTRDAMDEHFEDVCSWLHKNSGVPESITDDLEETLKELYGAVVAGDWNNFVTQSSWVANRLKLHAERVEYFATVELVAHFPPEARELLRELDSQATGGK